MSRSDVRLSLDRKIEEMTALQQQLRQSEELLRLFPQAFDGGPAASHWRASHDRVTLVITNGNGMRKEIAWADVPEILRGDFALRYQRDFPRGVGLGRDRRFSVSPVDDGQPTT